MLVFELIPPPLYSTVRVNTLYNDINETRNELEELINEGNDTQTFTVSIHKQLRDVLVIPSHKQQVEPKGKEIIVGYLCGMAVLRGANVFIPGILAAPKNLDKDDLVSVFADIKGNCLKGKSEFKMEKMFVGNGKSVVTRNNIFKTKGDIKLSGLGIIMTQVEWTAPCLNNVLTDKIFAQNLPSIIVGHVLNPKAEDKVLDMCASPGGKTQHLWELMGERGHLVAIDRSAKKVDSVRENLRNWFGELKENVELLVADSRKICQSLKVSDSQQFEANYFDKILLDAPCSALGQRPRVLNSAYDITNNQLSSYPTMQRQLFKTAIELLKPNGELVYSTCTTTVNENEGLVEWALKTYPNIELLKQQPYVGQPGRRDVTNLKEEDLKLLQMFHPLNNTEDLNVNNDTIGFFIAKFIKKVRPK